MQSGNTCVASTCSGSTFQSCTITNGVGNQSRTCNSGTWSAWGTCTLVSCNSGYIPSGNTCVLSTPSWQNGMVSWWRFNGDAKDYTGRNNGTVSGATLTSSGCKSGQCYSFDGNNDYINLGYSSSLNSTTYPYTVSVWVKPSSLTNDGIVMSLDPSGTNSDYAFGIYGSSNQLFLGTASYTFGLNGVSSYISTSTWKNWVIVFVSASQTKFYLDGVEQTLADLGGSYYISGGNIVGGRNGGTARYFSGLIDEPMIFNRSLSSSEIQQIYAYSYP
jgi:hypothetical protein